MNSCVILGSYNSLFHFFDLKSIHFITLSFSFFPLPFFPSAIPSPLSFFHSAIPSICHSSALPFFHSAILSICHSSPLPFLPLCHSSTLPFLPSAILPL